ncbi:MAG TPA: glycosyltransferase [Candidatus Acidoferrales bacterium]|nr:glycosyltransferase [Candidatus Acidoferrales bacterium]
MIDPSRPDYKDTPVSEKRARFRYIPADIAAQPQVSIITPFFNAGPVFHETARSVLQQSFQQWEWIIVDDASTDPQALEILNEYQASDPRIRVVHHATNRGPSAARNTAFGAAKSQFVVQLDSDNLLEPTAIEKWLWFLVSFPGAAFVKGYSVGFGAQQYLWSQGFHSGAAFLDANQVDTTSMIRKAVHQAVGGYDEAIREGLEDWDFWLRCASHGFWGASVPEYLDWYRRRANHTERWENWDRGERQAAFRARLRERYIKLWRGEFPRVAPHWHLPNETVPDELPCANALRKDGPRLLLIAPWLTAGGADKFNLDFLRQMKMRGWEVSIATTLQGDHSWLAEFSRLTPDIFALDHFLRLVDYPRFLRYLISSRGFDAVCIAHSELAYLLLPYLRAHAPDTAFMDFCHIEELSWKNGGYPRMAVEYQELLDLNVVSSEHLKNWMIERGADAARIRVCYTNIDTGEWRPDPEVRSRVRRELKLSEEVPVILYAARMCAQKQPKVFARTLLKLQADGHRFAAVVAGNGPELDWLRGFVKASELSGQVLLLGTVPLDRVRELMAAADIFFLPSDWEGIALTLYEAMATGLPVVTSDVGGQRELVTPECGFLINRGAEQAQVDDYAAALARLVQDPALRRRMGSAGRDRVVGHFTLEQMGENMARFVNEAVELYRTAPRPLPALGLGRACAATAIEYVRLCRLSDQLWVARASKDWRVQFYQSLRFFEPAFSWAVNVGFTWLVPIKEKLKQLLTQPA